MLSGRAINMTATQRAITNQTIPSVVMAVISPTKPDAISSAMKILFILLSPTSFDSHFLQVTLQGLIAKAV